MAVVGEINGGEDYYHRQAGKSGETRHRGRAAAVVAVLAVAGLVAFGSQTTKGESTPADEPTEAVSTGMEGLSADIQPIRGITFQGTLEGTTGLHVVADTLEVGDFGNTVFNAMSVAEPGSATSYRTPAAMVEDSSGTLQAGVLPFEAVGDTGSGGATIAVVQDGRLIGTAPFDADSSEQVIVTDIGDELRIQTEGPATPP